MTRALGLAAAAALGLLPLSVWPDWRLPIAGGVAAAACAGGVLLPSLGLAKTGGVLAIVVFAAATMTAPAGSALPASLLMGASLLIVLDLAALRQRSQFGGLGPGVLRTHLLRLGTCIAASAALLPILAVPAALAPAPGRIVRPLLALAGGLIAFAGVARMFLVSHATRGDGRP